MSSTSMYIAESMDKEVLQRTKAGVVTSLLRCALDTGFVDGVVTVKAKDGDKFSGVPVLINDSKELLETIGTLHCTAPNIARFVKEYLSGSLDMKLAIVGKPCDIRAIRELQKRQQISKENVLLIGLNCTGTLFPVNAVNMLKEEFKVDPKEVKDIDIDDGNLKVILEDGRVETRSLDTLEKKGYGRRENCRRCIYNIPTYADIACGKWGTKSESETFVEVCSDKGSTLIERAMGKSYIKVKKADTASINERKGRDSTEVERALKWREHDYKPLDDMSLAERYDYWSDQFSNCIKCYGCRDACPICYCESCLLEAERDYLQSGEVPPNIQFHLTRLAHVADSCVGCGQCSDACPMDIPLARLFSYANLKLNDIFSYSPGVDIDQGPPLFTAYDEEMHIDDVFLNIAEIVKKHREQNK